MHGGTGRTGTARPLNGVKGGCTPFGRSPKTKAQKAEINTAALREANAADSGLSRHASNSAHANASRPVYTPEAPDRGAARPGGLCSFLL